MPEVLVSSVGNLAVLLLVFRFLTEADPKRSDVVRIACGILAIYIGALWTLWIVPNSWALPITSCAVAIGTVALRGAGLAPLTDALGRYRFLLYLLSVLTLSLLICLFVPITTFLTAPGEIGLHLDYLLTVNVRDAMVCVYVAALLYATMVTSRMRTALTLLAISALALAVIYTYFLPLGYPRMTGLLFERMPVPLGSRLMRILCDGGVVVTTGFGLRALLVLHGARPIIVAVLLTLISLSGVAAVTVQRERVGGAGGADLIDQLTDLPLRFSKTQPNVLIIFLDRFMGSYVESIVADYPEVAELLNGFIWYPRTVSAGENSIAGVHPMLGGYDYVPHEMNSRGKPLRDLSAEAFSILPYNFARRGYRVNIVAPRGLGFTLSGDCAFLKIDGVHCTHIPQSIAKRRAEQLAFPLIDLSKSSYADLLVLLSSMRSAPYAMKEVIYRRGPWRPFMDHSAGSTFRQWAELHALADMSVTTADEPNFNFVSNILPHEPYYLGEDCLPRTDQLELSDAALRKRGHISLFSFQHSNAARCSLLAVVDYLGFLKQAGVYNNTKIVVVSDHGIVGAIEDHSTRAIAGGTEGEFYVRTRSVLLVKERNSAGTLRTSERFMPNAEVPRIVCEEVGSCVNPYLGDKPIQTMGRDDPFLVSIVPWQFTLQNWDSFVIEQQLTLTGKDPFDARGWKVNQSPIR